MNKTYRLVITGKVQGVWYRASAKDKALALMLTGKIWNNAHGDVEAVVQGPLDKIIEFVEWCKEGPPLANVDNVFYEEIIEDFIFTGFEISRSR